MLFSFNANHALRIGPFVVRINWLVLGCVLLTVATFIRLGFWQLGRAEEKLLQQSEYEARQLQNALPLEDISINDLQTDNSELSDLHVSLYGEYLNERTILVLAQFFDGQIGYEVITPFRLHANSRLALVSRGWTSGIVAANTAPITRPVSGVVRLTAQIYIPTGAVQTFTQQIDASEWPLRVRNVQMDILQEILAEPLFPYVLRLTEQQAGVLVRHWPVTHVNINSNLSYAMQWFFFAIVVMLASLVSSSNILPLLRGKS